VAFDSTFFYDLQFPDANQTSDVFVFKMTPHPVPLDCIPEVGFLAPVFVSTAGAPFSPTPISASGPSVRPVFSPDSAVILFESLADNLLDHLITPGAFQMYSRSIYSTNVPTCGGLEILAYGPTRLISYETTAAPEPTGRSVETPLPGGARNPRFSANSRFVAFENPPDKIYLHDLAGGFVQTIAVIDGVRLTNSARLTNVLICAQCGNPSLDADARFVAYEQRQPDSTHTNIVLTNLADGRELLIRGNRASFDPTLSFNGRFVLFTSRASDLVENDFNGTTDIFLFDRWNNFTACLSRNWQGTHTGNGLSSQPVLSADGRTVAFLSTASDLIQGDYNEGRDVFVVRLAGPDTDGDGLDDELEIGYFNTLDRDGTGDYDGDGVSDAIEIRAGTNPADGSSRLAVLSIRTTRAGGALSGGKQTTSLYWQSVPGQRYHVQFRENLDNAIWRDLGDAIVASGTTASFVHVSGAGATGYYRVRWENP
jgi:hypothetical protein